MSWLIIWFKSWLIWILTNFKLSLCCFWLHSLLIAAHSGRRSWWERCPGSVSSLFSHQSARFSLQPLVWIPEFKHPWSLWPAWHSHTMDTIEDCTKCKMYLCRANSFCRHREQIVGPLHGNPDQFWLMSLVGGSAEPHSHEFVYYSKNIIPLNWFYI